MHRIKIMINGVPGKMAVEVTKHALKDDRFELILHSLTGPEITEKNYLLDTTVIRLINPDIRDQLVLDLIKNEGPFISIDYTHPSAVNPNAEFYCRHNLPFVMGTTGGDRNLLEDTVRSSLIPAVIAPNMAKQIVGFQAMIEWCANTFPDLFKDFTLEIKESHQKGKADTSGTAKAILKNFNKLGMPLAEKDIKKERDPKLQKKIWNIPEEYIRQGHGWHTYNLISKDKTVSFSFSHNVNGRDVYCIGTLDAAFFLSEKVSAGAKKIIYSMTDVLKGV